MTDINYMNDLAVEVSVPTTGLQNLIKNPDGEYGGWGWESPVANTSVYAANDDFMGFTTTVTQAAYFRSEFLPVTAGQYAVARFTLVNIQASHNLKVRFEWYNSSKVLLSSSTQTAGFSAAGTHYVPAAQAPANTAYAKIRFDFHQGTGNAAANAVAYFYQVMVATSATSTGFGSIRENLFTDPAGTSATNWNAYSGYSTTVTTVSTPTPYNGTSAIRLHNSGGVGSTVIAESVDTDGDIVVTPGQFYTASAYTRSNGINRNWKIGIRYRIDGVWQNGWYVSSAVGNINGGWTRMHLTMQAPTGADLARLILASEASLPIGEYHFFDGFMFEQTNVLQAYFDGSTAAGGGVTYAWAGTANNSKSTATTASSSFAYNPPLAWLPITGSVTSLNIDREAMNLGTCSVVLKDESLDPAGSNKTLTPGKQVRVRANDAGTWKNIYTGKITNANVDYDKKKVAGSLVEGTITITAADALADLANQGESRSVADVDHLPYLLEGKGVPWNCNDVTSHYSGTPAIPVVNENLSVADQIVLTRDTERGHAWIDKNGVLQVVDASASWDLPEYYLSDVAVTDTTTNYMTNPGFESSGNGPFVMAGGGTMSKTTTSPHSGTQALRITASGAGPAMFYATGSGMSVPHSGQFLVTYWVRSSIAGAVVDFGNDDLVLSVANTWYQESTVLYASADGSGYTVSLDDTFFLYGANFANPTAGATFDFDDFSITAIEPDGSYSEIDVDWDTDRAMNHILVKHLTYDPEGKPVEVVYGPYENATSVATYGPKKAEFTIVGTHTSSTIQTFASNILAGNATPRVRANSVRVPVKDAKSLAFATNVDLSSMILTFFDIKIDSYYRVVSLSHSIDASGWYVDITFDSTSSNAIPQYTPAPPVEGAQTNTAWIDLPFLNSWGQYDTNSWRASYRRINGIVYVRGLVARAGGPTGASICQLPVGFRPLQNTIVRGATAPQADGARDGWMYVWADGSISYPNGDCSGTWSSVHCSFPADQ